MVYDVTAHTSELEKWDGDIVRNGITDLRTPADVAVGRDEVFLAFLGRDCFREGFNIRGIWLIKMHVDGFLLVRQEGYAKIMRGVDIF